MVDQENSLYTRRFILRAGVAGLGLGAAFALSGDSPISLHTPLKTQDISGPTLLADEYMPGYGDSRDIARQELEECIPFTESGRVVKLDELKFVSPSVDLTPALPSACSTVNTASFFINEHKIGLNGSHHLSQVMYGYDSYYVKWGRPNIYEHHLITPGEQIQLKEDVGGYTFDPGTWMPNSWVVGGEVKVVPNNIRRYNKKCFPFKAERFDYTMRFKGHFLLDLEGDLKVQDVIQVIYDYGHDRLPDTDYEVFYYAKDPKDGKGWGWVGWQQFNRRGRTIGKSWFNQFGKPPVHPDLKESCGPTYDSLEKSK